MNNIKAGLITFGFLFSYVGYIWMIIATVKKQDTIVEKIFYILCPWSFILKQGIDNKGKIPLVIVIFGSFMVLLGIILL